MPLRVKESERNLATTRLMNEVIKCLSTCYDTCYEKASFPGPTFCFLVFNWFCLLSPIFSFCGVMNYSSERNYLFLSRILI